jgi:hypothetical protein
MTTPYRDQRDVLWNRKIELEAEQAKLMQDQTRVASQAADNAAELERVRKELCDAPQATAKTSLDRLKVASPCSAKWSDMIGDERSRHCAQCDKSVYNISALTRAEAESFLAAQTSAPCVRYFQRVDGTILLQDCPVGARKRRLKVISAVAACAGLASAAVATMFNQTREVMGDVAGQVEVAGGTGWEPPLPPPPPEPGPSVKPQVETPAAK